MTTSSNCTCKGLLEKGTQSFFFLHSTAPQGTNWHGSFTSGLPKEEFRIWAAFNTQIPPGKLGVVTVKMKGNHIFVGIQLCPTRGIK